ncbi:MAG TPA: hypothetical protein HA262_08875 [Methanosarcina sp.]|jgi:hypothetical protein|nr:hypothetical protein [Methanosarcina sp.]
MVKEIQLTQGKVALVDDEFFPFLKRFSWCAHKQKNKDRLLFYARTVIRGKQIYMHQLILNSKQGMDCDHINGNGLDNRLKNLRTVTHRHNMINKHVKRSSKFPGVHWHKRDKRWRARAKINGKDLFFGNHKSELNAFKAYRNGLKAHGIDVTYLDEYCKENNLIEGLQSSSDDGSENALKSSTSYKLVVGE